MTHTKILIHAGHAMPCHVLYPTSLLPRPRPSLTTKALRTQVAITFYAYYVQSLGESFLRTIFVCICVHTYTKSQVAPTFNCKAENITNTHC